MRNKKALHGNYDEFLLSSRTKGKIVGLVLAYSRIPRIQTPRFQAILLRIRLCKALRWFWYWSKKPFSTVTIRRNVIGWMSSSSITVMNASRPPKIWGQELFGSLVESRSWRHVQRKGDRYNSQDDTRDDIPKTKFRSQESHKRKEFVSMFVMISECRRHRWVKKKSMKIHYNHKSVETIVGERICNVYLRKSELTAVKGKTKKSKRLSFTFRNSVDDSAQKLLEKVERRLVDADGGNHKRQSWRSARPVTTNKRKRYSNSPYDFGLMLLKIEPKWVNWGIDHRLGIPGGYPTVFNAVTLVWVASTSRGNNPSKSARMMYVLEFVLDGNVILSWLDGLDYFVWF